MILYCELSRNNDETVRVCLGNTPGIRLEGKVKIKVKLSLCFNYAPRHEGVLGEWRYSSTHSFTSGLDEGEWATSCPGHFTPR
jgi:hypothetical protein